MDSDVRSIANFVLDIAEEEGQRVSNFSANKIVFFLHAYFLVEFNRPLVSAKIEAWDHGPVFRELYRAFKNFGDKPITGRVSRIDPISGNPEICKYHFSEQERIFLEKIVREYVNFSARTLYGLSHEPGGPWDQVWNHGGATNASMQISNEIIRDWYERSARH